MCNRSDRAAVEKHAAGKASFSSTDPKGEDDGLWVSSRTSFSNWLSVLNLHAISFVANTVAHV